MTDFRIKLLGVAALATVFAGMSYGQVTCSNGPTVVPATPVAPSTFPSVPIIDRAEGQTELVSDIILTNCTNTSPAATSGFLTIYASLPVTSKSLTTGITVGANSDVTLNIYNTAITPQQTAANANGTVTAAATTGTAVANPSVQGTVSSSTITFSGLTFPATFSLQISNVRVNASTAAASSSPVAVTETIFAGLNGLATVNFSGVTVGDILQSLVKPAFTINPASGNPLINNIAVCAGNPITNTTQATTVSFNTIISEAFGGAFKTQTGAAVTNAGVAVPAVLQNGEQGSYVSNNAIGTATSGTEITLTYANVPSAATLYVPTTVSYTPAVGTTLAQLTLTGSPTVATTPGAAASGAIPATGVYALPTGPSAATTFSTIAYTFGGFTAVTPSNGSITLTYQVTSSTAAQAETFVVPTYVTVPANAATAQSAITVLEAYAPTGTVSGPAAAIPTFGATTNTALSGSVVSLCVTNLLFPFITNNLGYDTGIVLANTTTDPFGTVHGATPTSSTCTLNFYGSGAPTPASFPYTPVASGTDAAFTLSSVAPGFQGYLIAQCNSLFIHGYAFLTNGATAGNAAVAQGYSAEVLDPVFNGAGGGTRGAVLGAGTLNESSGQ
jgi:hypothetical protein